MVDESYGFNGKDRSLLARIDERTGRTEEDVKLIWKEFSKYVTKERHRPVELIAYGLAGGTLITVLGVILAKLAGL